MNTWTRTRAVAVVVGIIWVSCVARPAAAQSFSGSIGGQVTDGSGIPQMGATVLLFNRYERLLQRVLTQDDGSFGFASLVPDVYSIRVNLVSFVPALKQNIRVQPGMRSLLDVSLASVLSSIELVYTAPGQRAVMSDDWKWVLRSASATRPVLRLSPTVDYSDPSTSHKSSISAFSDTRGVIRLSAGDPGASSAYGNQPDLGTAFALATSLMGRNQLQVSGNVGYATRSGMPVAGFRTSYSRDMDFGESPEVNLTMRQVFLPARVGAAMISGHQEGVPALRTMSLGFLDHTQFNEALRLEYGFSLEAVSFLERLNYASRFARLTYDDPAMGAIAFGYISGVPPAEFISRPQGPEAELYSDLTALALLPRLSLRHGDVRVQRAKSFEIGYQRVVGSRTYSVAVFRERVSDAALMLSSADGFVAAGELVPDLISDSWVFNAGEVNSVGYMASVSQQLGNHLSVTIAHGNGGVLEAQRRPLLTGDPDELRAMISGARRGWITARVSGSSPWTGTQFISSYQWADGESLTPGHFFVTQTMSPEIGLNIFLRQPIPALTCLGGGRLEANADLRNLLAQGYLPLSRPDGRRVYLMHTPRSVRGGVSFIF